MSDTDAYLAKAKAKVDRKIECDKLFADLRRQRDEAEPAMKRPCEASDEARDDRKSGFDKATGRFR